MPTRRLLAHAVLLAVLRNSDIDATSPAVIRIMWGLQSIILVLAAWGAIRLVAQQKLVEAWWLMTPLLYVTAVHLPLLTEARPSLPVKPLLLIAATIGAANVHRRVRLHPVQTHNAQRA